VVLLAAHGSAGAFGWVINGRDVMTFDELLEQTELSKGSLKSDRAVRLGGPVGREQVWLLYPTEPSLEGLGDQFEVGAGITASPSQKVLQAVVDGQMPGSLMGLLGYAGWAPEQLEEEIRRGAWLPTDVSRELVFQAERDIIWQRAYERLGASPMAFTTKTVGSA
jgi:putative transcriptional regulator